MPAELALTVWDALHEAGPAFGFRNVGLGAMGSLRLEKAYRDFGLDIDNTDTPFDVGLGFAVAGEITRDQEFNSDAGVGVAQISAAGKGRRIAQSVATLAQHVVLLASEENVYVHGGANIAMDAERQSVRH